MLLPASDFALGLAAGQAFQGDMKTAAKLGVTEKEIDKALRLPCSRRSKKARSTPKACAKPPAKPPAISATGRQEERPHHHAPVALEKLQACGDIRRVPVNGRFDQQRYQYALWRPNPLRGFKLSPEQVNTELARAYFSWIGPASLAEFQTFSALGVKAAQAAVQPLKLEAIETASRRHPTCSCRTIAPKFEAFKVPKEPQYSLLGSIDSLFLLRGDLAAVVDPSDAKRPVLANLRSDLPSHAIVDRGRLIGLWEYDQSTESIAWMCFAKKDKALQEAVTRTEEFVRDQLGDARSFSLDSPKSRAPRIAALRKAAANA